MYDEVTSILDETPSKFIAKLDAQKNKWHHRKEQSLMYLYAKIHKKKNKGVYFTAFVVSHVTDTA